MTLSSRLVPTRCLSVCLAGCLSQNCKPAKIEKLRGLADCLVCSCLSVGQGNAARPPVFRQRKRDEARQAGRHKSTQAQRQAQKQARTQTQAPTQTGRYSVRESAGEHVWSHSSGRLDPPRHRNAHTPKHGDAGTGPNTVTQALAQTRKHSDTGTGPNTKT